MRPDPNLISLTGSTKSGMPLAYSRLPNEDLNEMVHSLAVANVIQGEGEKITCGTFIDNASFRVLLTGHWTAHTADGPIEFDADAGSHVLYFGPHTKSMPFSVRGPFAFLSMQLRPGMPAPVPGKTLEMMADRIFSFNDLIPAEKRGTFFLPDDPPSRWLDVFENVARNIFNAVQPPLPHASAKHFEEQLLLNAHVDLDQIADELGMSRRSMERHIKQAFGATATQVARRARVLDMAAFLLGVAFPEEEQEFRLRYFDDAHLVHEFQHFFGASPGQFARKDCQLLRIDLEVRQLRRLAAVRSLGRDAVPWRDQNSEPTSG